ncbi:MAG: ATP-binding cassette domain-containing protein [Myxococcales bacterium]|jgi:phospholipid/cholesterol/gamma-HCH transport system ATP-binding protein|nr:ATP-binding cassette domain-containing protein [Myxococcales bacterium]
MSEREAPLLEFRDVDKAFDGKPVLSSMSLSVRRHERLFLVGTSGVGKSVAIRLLIGLLRVDAGELRFHGARIDELSEAALLPLRRKIGMVFQHSTLFDSMTVLDNVALPLRKHGGLGLAAARVAARERLAAVRMEQHAARMPAEISDGMRKRVAIARTLAMRPEVVLFDEPTTGLDPVSARHVDALIAELPATAGVTALVVSHDLISIRTVADRVALLYRGRIHALGTPAELAASPDPVVAQFLAGRSQGPMDTPGF